MKNSDSKPILGVIFILLGVLLAARIFGFIDYISFNGWWTFFIIIPCLIGLFRGGNPSGSFLGLGIGVILFLGMNHLISWRVMPQLLAGFIFATIGLSFLFKDENIKSNKRKHTEDSRRSYDNESKGNTKQDKDYEEQWKAYDNQYDKEYGGQGFHKTYGSRRHNQYNAVLSGRVIQFMEEEFTGCSVTSILGNLQLDLRNAIIRDDVVLDVTCLIGGLDIFVPNNVKVSVSCTPILGGVENRVSFSGWGSQDTKTIYIKGTCVLGGIEIK